MLEIFYSALNSITEDVANTIIGGAFMILCCKIVEEILGQISKTNQEWHTQKEEREVGTYVIGAFSEYRSIDEIVAQEVE